MPATEERIAALELATTVHGVTIHSLEQAAGDFRAEVNRRFDQVDRRFDNLDARFLGIEGRLTSLDQKIDHLRIEVEGKIGGLEQKVSAVAQKIDAVGESLAVNFRWLGGLVAALVIAIVTAMISR